MTVIARGFAVLFCLLFGAGAALADKRVALLIGNARYEAVAALNNPANDVAAMKGSLEAARFDKVQTVLDAGRGDMIKALRAFTDEAADADIALVYYSGHGLEMNGQNYLVPIDARLASDLDVDDEAVPLDRVLRSIDGAKRLKLVILDACRNNPFLPKMARKDASRAVKRGLARVDQLPVGTIIAYAAKAGTLSSDGEGPNSPFTAALVRHLFEPGLDVRLAFDKVTDEVMTSTRPAQEPSMYIGALRGGAVLSKVEAVAGVGAPPQTPAPSAPLYPFGGFYGFDSGPEYEKALKDEKYLKLAGELTTKGIIALPLTAQTACFARFTVIQDDGRFEDYVLSSRGQIKTADEISAMALSYKLTDWGQCSYDRLAGIDTCRTTLTDGKDGGTNYLYYLDPKGMSFVSSSKSEDIPKLKSDPASFEKWSQIDCKAYRDVLTSHIAMGDTSALNDMSGLIGAWIAQNVLTGPGRPFLDAIAKIADLNGR